MMCSDPRRTSIASGRSKPWVSEMTPIRIGAIRSWVLRSWSFHSSLASSDFLTFSSPRLFDEFANADDSSADSAATDFLDVVARGYAQSVEAPVKRLQHGFRPDVGADAAGRTVLDVDRSPHRNLVALTVRLKSVESRGLHEADHVGSGINRRQLGVMRGQRVFELDRFLRLAARPDGDLLGQVYLLLILL